MHDVREIETWILRLLSAPVPVPGRTRVDLDLLPAPGEDEGDPYPSRRRSLVFALPDRNRFSLCDYPLHLPIEVLGVDTCLAVLTLVLLERKVLLKSQNYSTLSFSVLSITKLLYPLEYMFPVIPLLPVSLGGAEQLLMAPTPYLIGVPTSFLVVKRNIHLPEDVWLVDLDAGTIVPPEGVSLADIPGLPEPEGRVLKNHFRQSLASMPTSFRPIKNFEDLSADALKRLAAEKDNFSSPSMCGFNPFIYGNDVDSVDVATRIAMVGAVAVSRARGLMDRAVAVVCT